MSQAGGGMSLSAVRARFLAHFRRAGAPAHSHEGLSASPNPNKRSARPTVNAALVDSIHSNDSSGERRQGRFQRVDRPASLAGMPGVPLRVSPAFSGASPSTLSPHFSATAEGNVPLAHFMAPSASLIPPVADESLLFTAAGMVPFKEAFLHGRVPELDHEVEGDKSASLHARRVVSSQRCLRVNDIDLVGRTARHHTFFEMLGTFSFGMGYQRQENDAPLDKAAASLQALQTPYTPRDIQAMAWRFLVDDVGLDPERLCVTVHPDDADAVQAWRDIGLPRSRIREDSDNFWSMGAGAAGPCGPCSEIYYDLGVPDADGESWLELWNLVFMQYRREAGDDTLFPLEASSIDTGMGLERLASVLQGKSSNYETDLFVALQTAVLAHFFEDVDADLALAVAVGPSPVAVEAIAELCRGDAVPSAEMLTDVRCMLRVIADHLRASAFLISDGVVPSSVGRGYVLRRLIRRATRCAAEIRAKLHGGNPEPVLSAVFPDLVREMGDAYPELADRSDVILSVLWNEESAFVGTLHEGLVRAHDLVKSNAASRVLPAQGIFDLYSRYGFPMDMTTQIAREHGYSADVVGAEELLERQKEQSRQNHPWGSQGGVPEPVARWQQEASQTEFCGHTQLTVDSTTVLRVHSQNDLVWVALGESPFYPPGGGQVGDTGTITARTKNGLVSATVIDTLAPYAPCGGILVLKSEVGESAHKLADALSECDPGSVSAVVDGSRRRAIERHHTATHLLNAALKAVLSGTTTVEGPRGVVHQAGSHVGPDRLRFDFTWNRALNREELQQVERLVNSAIAADVNVGASLQSREVAIASGAAAVFSEKYEDIVRVVKVDGLAGESPLFESAELCGGTHVSRTGDIGAFAITGERSVALNTRRIEALCGPSAVAWFSSRSHMLGRVAEMFEVPDSPLGQPASEIGDVHSVVPAIERERRSARQQKSESRKLRALLDKHDVETLDIAARGDLPAICVHFHSNVEMADLRRRGLAMQNKEGIVHVLVSGQYVVAVADGSEGINASHVLSNYVFQDVCAGRGGGKASVAQGKVAGSGFSDAEWRARFLASQ